MALVTSPGATLRAIDNASIDATPLAGGQARIAGFSWKKPGASIQRSAPSHRNRLRSRLNPRLGLERQESMGPLFGSGLRYRPVAHAGNQRSSPEEAEVVSSLVIDVLS